MYELGTGAGLGGAEPEDSSPYLLVSSAKMRSTSDWSAEGGDAVADEPYDDEEPYEETGWNGSLTEGDEYSSSFIPSCLFASRTRVIITSFSLSDITLELASNTAVAGIAGASIFSSKTFFSSTAASSFLGSAITTSAAAVCTGAARTGAAVVAVAPAVASSFFGPAIAFTSELRTINAAPAPTAAYAGVEYSMAHANSTPERNHDTAMRTTVRVIAARDLKGLAMRIFAHSPLAMAAMKYATPSLVLATASASGDPSMGLAAGPEGAAELAPEAAPVAISPIFLTPAPAASYASSAISTVRSHARTAPVFAVTTAALTAS